MRDQLKKGAALVAGALLFAVTLSGVAEAESLRKGSTSSSAAVTGSLPGEVLWTYFQTVQDGLLCPPGSNVLNNNLCNTFSGGSTSLTNVFAFDNIIRLINPNGAANGNLAGVTTQTVCAMIYVFDDDQEMGECCGCPLSSAQLATFSVVNNLTSNWGLNVPPKSSELPPQFTPDNGVGSIAIVAAAPNTSKCVGGGGGNACNGGCDPTNVPGYSVTTDDNLLGSITHDQAVLERRITSDLGLAIEGITETALSDDAAGDPTNLIYLQDQCGAIVGNGTGGGICNCPTEG